jgi:3'-phosphoadenosine 5'-phosphosulfate sulfotransferase (PAPS reductase)/FAD synthetase
MNTLDELIEQSPTLAILDSFVIANSKLNNPNYKNIYASISGGADSDIVLDICTKLDVNKKIRYVFFDTGLEYEATKNHLEYLEKKYNITIEKVKAKKPIPITCREYGQPFISKWVSECINALQRHNFKWEDKPYEELIKEYPKIKTYIGWWCNVKQRGKDTRFSIAHNKYLKEFLIEYPPYFPISKKCCYYAKKSPAKTFMKDNDIGLEMIGVRKSEGGIRATSYKNCFTNNDYLRDQYRPIFWYTNEDKKAYDEAFNVTHSKCYTEYGFTRTGCAGCPYNPNLENDLKVIEKYEPKLYKAVNKIFGNSYEYTKKYREFVKNMEGK